MEFIANFFDNLWEFLSILPEFLYDLSVHVGTWMTIASLKAQVAIIEFSWDVAQQVLNQLDVSSTIDAYWGQLDSQVLGIMTYLKLPEAFNMILNAAVTRYVMEVVT